MTTKKKAFLISLKRKRKKKKPIRMEGLFETLLHLHGEKGHFFIASYWRKKQYEGNEKSCFF